jgi:hypothetical protein
MAMIASIPIASIGDIQEEMMGRVRMDPPRSCGQFGCKDSVSDMSSMGGPVVFDDALVVSFRKALLGKMCCR